MKEEATKLVVVASNTGNALRPNIWNKINLDRPSDGGGGGRLGPTGSNSGGANEVMVDHTDTVHRRDEYISSSSDARFPATCSNYNNPYKFPGEMVPFTSAQWKELERQAMIYKYMISSVPVPPHLLYPPPSSLYSVGYSKNGGGMEAGRCKRTDGKKWRCSRDVAPHQKYCERHLHRGRGSRSRKPVEEEEEEEVVVSNNKFMYKNNGDDQHKKPRVDEQTPKHSTPANDARTDLTSWDLGLTVESDTVAQQKWHHLLEANMGFTNEGSSGAIFRQEYYNVDRYPSGHHHHHHHVISYSSFPASEIGIDLPIGFTDGWSIDNPDNNINQNVHVKSSLLVNEENFSSWLNLSMAGGDVLDEEMGNVRTSDGVDLCDGDARLVLSPICREAFGPGGPLGEALCGNPHDSVSGPVTTVSSPSSGVLQRSLFSRG